jgi:Tfp pilus assembly protein PilF
MVAAAVILFFLQTPDYDAEGAKALEERNYDAAAASFAKAIAADPRDYYAHFNLAMAYTFLHKDDEALAEYRQTLEVKPGLYEAELNGGILLLLRKNPADALPLLEDAATQKPKEYGPRFYLAEAQLQSGVADKAAENYRLAAELDPKSAAAESGWGRALAIEGKLDEAAPHFRLAVERDPKYRDSLLSLAELFEENKQMAEALAIYREFPGNAAVQERAGQLLLQSQKFAEAVPQLEQAYQKAPTERPWPRRICRFSSPTRRCRCSKKRWPTSPPITTSAWAMRTPCATGNCIPRPPRSSMRPPNSNRPRPGRGLNWVACCTWPGIAPMRWRPWRRPASWETILPATGF